MPIALTPTDGSYDAYGTFTGSVLPSGEGASIVYTGVTKVGTAGETIRNEGLREQQCIATTSDPDLRAFHKLAAPVIEHPPQGMKVTGFRDPFAWKDGDTWYMGVGSGVSGVGGMVLLYRSNDARLWEYLHPLAQGVWNGQSFSNPVPSGEMWECPDFFALGDRFVLLYSTEGKTIWEVGTFDRQELRFHSELKGVLDHGAYYAPKSMPDPKGRRILWAWVQETRPREETVAAGWAGCMSLPRVLSIGANGALQINIAEELDILRTHTIEIVTKKNSDELHRALQAIRLPGRAGQIRYSFMAAEEPCGLDLYLGEAKESAPLLSISYKATPSGERMLMVGDKSVPLTPGANRRSEVTLWVDGSVVELIADRRHAVTVRTYAQAASAQPIRLSWSGDPKALIHLSASEVRPISADRLTS
jgi:beta-fructofuranosidase